MLKKIILLASSIAVVTVPALTLSSCGQASQFSPNVTIRINNEEYSVGYGTNNVIYGTDKKQLDANATTTKDLVKFYVTSILPFFTINDRLINLSHFSADKNTANLIYENNLIFDQAETWTNGAPNVFFKEFMYASTNVLNQGRNEQIKLYLSEVNVEGLTNGYLPYTKTAPVTNKKIHVDKLSKPIELKENQKIYVYDATNGYKLADNQNGVYYSNSGYFLQDLPTFTLNLKYRYYYPESQDRFREYIKNVDTIKNYVNKYNAWNKEVEPTSIEFNVKTNLQVILRPKFEFSPYIIKTGDNLPTEEEAKKLVELVEVTNNTDSYYETTLDFNEKGESAKFSNWIYEVKFLPTSNVNVSNQTTPLLFKLKGSENNNGANDFSNSNILNTAMGTISTTPSINTSEDYNKFIDRIKEFKSFLSLKTS